MKPSYLHNVPAVFADVVRRYPDRNAIVWSESTAVTFSELDRLSDRAALLLRQQGVAKGDRVCIRLDKCTLAYALIVACLKSGCPYFVVDPANPAARTNQILAKCRPKIVFSANESPLEASHGQVVGVDAENQFAVLSGAADGGVFVPDADIIGTDPAYIMFTSGSTGVPKGAVMCHANLLNFIAWAKSEFSISPDDVFTNVNPLYFDNSVFDLYCSLFNGASLVPFDAATMKDPYQVISRIDATACTIYFSVPSLLIYLQTLKLLTPAVFTHVRAIVFGGEGYPKTKLKELFDCFASRCRLVNVYGPTECTCICSAYDLSAEDLSELDGYPPLGSLIPNFAGAVLDDRDRPTAADEIGELWLSGPCVGLGYFNDPELTASAFRQSPVNAFTYERLYRTGDLVRLSSRDGKLHFVGRTDSQIKHQGYRIELGEIESALGHVEGVDEAVVLHSVREGISAIVAIVASRAGLTVDAIRKDVARFVPAYMVPGRVDILDRLPKNANGKVDRNLLKTRYC